MRNGESMVPSGQSVGSLEREIAHTRARMDSILSSLEATLTPGMIFDRALEYLKNQELAKRAGKAVGKTAWQQMRANPVAFGMMGAGVAYWIFGGKDKDKEHGRGRYQESHPYEARDVGSRYVDERDEGHGLKERIEEKAESARSRAHATAEEARSKAQDAKAKVSGATSKARSSVRGAASNVKAKASGVAEAARSRAGDMGRSMKGAYGKAAESGRSAAHKAKEGASRAGSTLAENAREHPFLFAGLAMMAAAIAGSLIRPTRREDRLLGPQRDRFLQRADEMGARGVEKARDVANKAFEAAHEKVASTDESEVTDAIEAEVREGDGADESELEATGTVPPTSEPGSDELGRS